MKHAVRRLEDAWFDRTRGIETGGTLDGFDGVQVVGSVRDALPYIPVRVATARAALAAMPVTDYSQYSFVDVGSGKGRMLFVAAEFPFRRVIGIEFVVALHDAATRNIHRFRRGRQRSGLIESINADATTFDWPAGPLVLFLFNPFGPATFEAVLRSLQASLDRSPRHVVLVLLWPTLAPSMATMPAMRAHVQNPRFHVYEAGPRAVRAWP